MATFRHTDTSPKEQFLNHNAGLGGFGGAHGGVGGYIDHVVMRATATPTRPGPPPPTGRWRNGATPARTGVPTSRRSSPPRVSSSKRSRTPRTGSPQASREATPTRMATGTPPTQRPSPAAPTRSARTPSSTTTPTPPTSPSPTPSRAVTRHWDAASSPLPPSATARDTPATRTTSICSSSTTSGTESSMMCWDGGRGEIRWDMWMDSICRHIPTINPLLKSMLMD